jgi:hypothetical protein
VSSAPDPSAKLRSVAPDPSPEEAAAIMAAITRFAAETAVPATEQAPIQSPWQRAALAEGVARAASWRQREYPARG